MEDVKFFDGTRMFKFSLDSNDVLVISMPSDIYYNPEVSDKLRAFAKHIEKYLLERGFNNPLLVLPGDMELFRLSIKRFDNMEEIEEEIEGFEGFEWKL